MTLTVLEGSTFCICDELGDVDGETTGFFAEDTRFLSLLRLTVNGARPLLLSSGKVEYFSAAFYMRNPLAGGLPQDALTIVRTRFVGDAMQDHLTVENASQQPVELELSLELGSDFADIFTVKEHDF
ncbi:MAG TPA: glycogen debranching N-terminal domain-containing protein, partial [Gaiellaceae bacterium]